MEDKKETRGGSRPGAGAPKKAPTKNVTFRLRIDEIDHIKKMVKKEVAKLRKANPNRPKQ